MNNQIDIDINKIKNDIINLAIEMTENGDLNPQGHRFENGADYYFCRSCYTSKDGEGYISPCDGDFDDIDHKPDCKFKMLRELIDKLNECEE